MSDPWSWQRYPFDSMSRHVGPLPAGTYRVSAFVEGRGTVMSELTLTPGETREVELKF